MYPPGQRERQPAAHGAHALPGPGDVIAGKYAIVKVIGEGGMGVVFEATHLRLRQRVAVKMLLPEMLAHEVIVTRFEREARASGQLRNRHAVKVMDVDVTPEGLPYMVMEFLEGHDLQVELDRRGCLPYPEAVDIVLQACSAMIAAHQIGIIHRDLKPANLFLAQESDAHDARIVKVLDFGISKVQAEGDAKLTVADSVIGTAMYMSPEQLRASEKVDARSDIWSLGIILFELLAGRPPWVGSPTQLAAAVSVEDAPDVRSLVPDLPPDIALIVATALRRDPAARFGDVKQLALSLAPFTLPGGAGRLLAESLLQSSSGQFPRVSIRPPPLEEARTMVQAQAVSESRMSGTGPATAPGWSQHDRTPVRHRTVVVGFLLAFAVGLLVVGGSVLGWLRWSAARSRDRAAAHASANAPVVAAPVVTSASVGPRPLGDPPASAPATPATIVTEAPPATGLTRATTALPRQGPGAAASNAAPRASVAPQTPTIARPAPAAPPAPAVKPPPAPSGNPLLL
jgi:serine/threonine protein kinase